jgi:hypothetical protein
MKADRQDQNGDAARDRGDCYEYRARAAGLVYDEREQCGGGGGDAKQVQRPSP